MALTDLLFCISIFIFSLTLTAAFEKRLVPFLKKKAEQPIYSEGPRWHMKKQGTPTMGGLGFAFAALSILTAIGVYLFFIGEEYYSKSLFITLIYALMNTLIGFIDDFAKIRKKDNMGLKPIQKLILQGAAAALFILARQTLLFSSTEIIFRFASIDLGVSYFPLVLIMLLGTVNCANLTDGVDGLAAAVAFAVGISLAYLSFNSSYDVSLVSFALMGCAIGFLFFNVHPAKIFMGDTGSLFFGSIIAACCCALGNPLIIIFVGIVYLIEGLSVIIQVIFFKLTKKRIFKMAPLHHHFEKCGWSENKIVIFAIIATLVFSVASEFLFI